MKAFLEITKIDVNDIITTSTGMNIEPGTGGSGTLKPLNSEEPMDLSQ